MITIYIKIANKPLQQYP